MCSEIVHCEGMGIYIYIYVVVFVGSELFFYSCIYTFKLKIVLSLNNTVCDNYTNYTNKHVTKRTENRHVNILGIPCPQF